MTISYIELGAHKKLNEIVMAGSHDAGITGGGGNVQTQDLDITGQAQAGVRVFDLRIAAATLSDYTGDGKEAELRAFHADPKLTTSTTKSRFVLDTGSQHLIKRTKLRGGAWGQGLSTMLDEARKFVGDTAPDEFLIFKFDKSSNWGLIAETCVKVLGDRIYTGGGNLNTKTLRDLSGKVVVVFTTSGAAEAAKSHYGPKEGILGIRNLKSDKGGYNPNFQGMQYFGKGGTDPLKPFGKIGQNQKKQAELMKKGAGTNPEVMGMMYWTTTGLLESIKDRNDSMWTTENRKALKKLWHNGLWESINQRIASSVNVGSFSSGPVLKTFMPNIVMIDFANEDKCKTIHELNYLASTDLADVSSIMNA